MKTKLATILVSMVLIASAGACKKKGNGGGRSSWIVGQDGAMVRLDHATGAVVDYALESDADLLDIACRGEDAAWVVGEGGTALRTLDGGDSWEALDVGAVGDLYAVATAAHDVVYAAGDGPLLVSDDSGASWRAVAGSEALWTDVATMFDGGVALGATADGRIFRYDRDGDALALVHTAELAVNAVSMTPDGRRAIAVGEGAVLESDDGGLSWRARAETEEVPGLLAVALSASGDLAVALGDEGAVAHIDGASVELIRLLDADQALRALHLSASGRAIAVGDDGAAFVSDDTGHTWTALDLGTDATWFGVDDLHGEPHL